MVISETMLAKIEEALEKARKKKEVLLTYKEAFIQAEQERLALPGGLGRRGWMRCGYCANRCKRSRYPEVMWPSPREGQKCPMCGNCVLARVSVI